MEVELDDNGRVELTDERKRPVKCAYSGKSIPSDEHRINITLPSDDFIDEVDWKTTHINISIDAIDEFRSKLESGNEFERGDIKRAYYRNGQGFVCPICDHDRYVITDDHLGVVRVYDGSDLKMRFFNHLCWLHGGCADEFSETLGRAWDHAPDVLGDIV